MSRDDIIIKDEDWIDGNEGQDGLAPRLLTPITINGTSLHLTAIAVETRDGCQGAVNAEDEDDIVALYLHGTDGPFETTEIFGRPFVLFALPYGQ